MKNLMLLFCLFISMSYACAQSTIGDVKYSILEPRAFLPLNPGWVLMDGSSLVGTKLNRIWGKGSRLPDARGLFIRGMNDGRDTKTGDADGNREAGSQQTDDFKSHTHTAELRQTNNAPFGSGPYINPVEPQRPTASHRPVTIDATGGKETRPRNVALYIYIKVN